MTDTAGVPVALLAPEHGLKVHELIRMLGDRVYRDDCGVRCVGRDDARALFERLQAEEAARAEADRPRLEKIRVEAEATHARVRAIQRQQEELLASGQVDPGAGAMAMLLGGDKQDRLDRAGRRMDDLLAGRCTAASLSPPELWERRD